MLDLLYIDIYLNLWRILSMLDVQKPLDSLDGAI